MTLLWQIVSLARVSMLVLSAVLRDDEEFVFEPVRCACRCSLHVFDDALMRACR